MIDKKFSNQKDEAEKGIHKILTSFKKETGVSINYVDFSTKNHTGFDHADAEYETKIKLKNDD